MAKSKNLKITTEQIIATGTLNVDNLENPILLETEDGEIDLSSYLASLNGQEVEISIKKKIEQVL